MAEDVQFKVCGLTFLADAEAADRAGANFLGFILHPKSPRFVSLETANAIGAGLPGCKRVAVSVEPTLAGLKQQLEAGFDYFQIHFRHELPLEQVRAWSELVSPGRLWLAPKLPPEIEINPEHLALANTILFDTYQPAGFGGSGRTGDWAKFARSQAQHPGTAWILAGGLSPENIEAALAESGARVVDVNSGIESSPGVKDHAKLESFIRHLRGGSVTSS